MAKEWILNSAMNRYQLNFKRNVGATSESIRQCAPKNMEEWKNYYYSNVRSEQHIEELGRRLYVKITEVISSEVESITEQDCIDYMKELVINRTYEGYNTEIQTIYGQLAVLLNQEILAAPDEWDRLYNVDFYIKIGENHIGLQIKPINNHLQISEIHKEYALQAKTHEKFKKQYGGKVFYIYSEKVNNKKVIANIEVVDEIKEEIARLSNINI